MIIKWVKKIKQIDISKIKTNRKDSIFYFNKNILTKDSKEFNKFDFGSIYSTFGKNDVEGLRLRVGGRTYLGGNEPWRLQGYTAYGFDDDKFKYGMSGKWMLNPKSRFIIGGGNRRDVEQIGVSLTTTNDVLGRSFASSSLFSSGDNSKLTSINLSNVFMSIEPKKNLDFRITNYDLGF